MNVFTIHHTAGSGGSICSQYFAAAGNALLISEISPHGALYSSRSKNPNLNQRLRGFSPGRPLDHALLDSGCDLSPALKEKFFASQLDICFSHASEIGKNVLLREHSHSAYGFEGRQRLGLLEFLARCGDGYWQESLIKFWKPVFTIRHPLDNFVSARSKNWHLCYSRDGLFDSYCREILHMQQWYVKRWGALVLRYEDLCVSPDSFLASLSSGLDCGFLAAPSAAEVDSVAVTGKSGRKASAIRLPARQADLIVDDLRSEVESSKSYQELCALNGYCTGISSGPI